MQHPKEVLGQGGKNLEKFKKNFHICLRYSVKTISPFFHIIDGNNTKRKTHL